MLILHIFLQHGDQANGAALQLLRQLREDADSSVSRVAWSCFYADEL